LCEHAELVEGTWDRKPAAVGENPEGIGDYVFRSLKNTAPF
jgi:hypothetical protein